MNIKPDRLRRIRAVDGATDARKLALELMVEALELLDRDASINPLIGSHLQLAIDRLVSLQSEGPGILGRATITAT
jgi:hypothetical protein